MYSHYWVIQQNLLSQSKNRFREISVVLLEKQRNSSVCPYGHLSLRTTEKMQNIVEEALFDQVIRAPNEIVVDTIIPAILENLWKFVPSNCHPSHSNRVGSHLSEENQKAKIRKIFSVFVPLGEEFQKKWPFFFASLVKYSVFQLGFHPFHRIAFQFFSSNH